MFLSIYYIRIYRGQLLSYVTVYKEDNGAEADVNVSPFETDEIKRGGNGEFYTVLQQMQQIEAFVERSMPWTGWSIMSLDLIYFIIIL